VSHFFFLEKKLFHSSRSAENQTSRTYNGCESNAHFQHTQEYFDDLGTATQSRHTVNILSDFEDVTLFYAVEVKCRTLIFFNTWKV
jgi:hypothetical protein